MDSLSLGFCNLRGLRRGVWKAAKTSGTLRRHVESSPSLVSRHLGAGHWQTYQWMQCQSVAGRGHSRKPCPVLSLCTAVVL